MASRIYKFSKIQNFNLKHQPQLGASFSHGLTSVSRVQRRVVTLHAITPIGAYNDVRVEVCIIILERIFMMYFYRVYHIKSIYFSKSAAGFGRVATARSFSNWPFAESSTCGSPCALFDVILLWRHNNASIWRAIWLWRHNGKVCQQVRCRAFGYQAIGHAPR